MSDIPSVEEQIPSIEEIFSSLEGHPPDEQVPVLAAILQAVLGQMSEMEKSHQELCQRVNTLDNEIYKPIQKGYKAKVRGMGIDGLKQKYGAKFDPILGELKDGFGIEDAYGKLYDMLEKLKEGGSYNEADEGTIMDDQYNEAMKRISAIRGPKPEEKAEPAAEAPAEEKQAEVAVETKTVEAKPAEKLSEKPSLKDKKKRMTMIDGY